MSFSAIVTALLALARSFPLLAQLVLEVARAIERDRDATAAKRRAEKDAAVDRSIDAP